MYDDYLVTSDMSHVTHNMQKIQKSKFSWSGLFKLNTIRHEPLCTAFHHRRVHSMSCSVRHAIAKDLKRLVNFCNRSCDIGKGCRPK